MIKYDLEYSGFKVIGNVRVESYKNKSFILVLI